MSDLTREQIEWIRAGNITDARLVALCDMALRSLDGVVVPRELVVSVDAQGVHFGKWAWVSHEVIAGCNAKHIPEKQKQYYEWWKAMMLLAAASEQNDPLNGRSKTTVRYLTINGGGDAD